MADIEKDVLLDLRVRNLNLKCGKITRQEIATHLKNLPDDGEWGEEHVVYKEAEETPEAESGTSEETASE